MFGRLTNTHLRLNSIDVTHPSPKSRKGTPSLPAVVASVDDNFVQFPASLGLQRNQRKDREAEEVSSVAASSPENDSVINVP